MVDVCSVWDYEAQFVNQGALLSLYYQIWFFCQLSVGAREYGEFITNQMESE